MNIEERISQFAPLAELEQRQDGLLEIAAERLGVTPESLSASGMNAEWFSNPENMPPPPGSDLWIKPGSKFYDAFKRLLEDGDL